MYMYASVYVITISNYVKNAYSRGSGGMPTKKSLEIRCEESKLVEFKFQPLNNMIKAQHEVNGRAQVAKQQYS